MKWLKPFTSLTQKVTLSSKKRTQQEAISSSIDEVTDTGDFGTSEAEEEFNSRPKRRSMEVPSHCSFDKRASLDRRTSVEQWHAARRMRNSLDGEGTVTTDRLTLCKAGSTTIVNKTYITIKHLGSGTFGRVMLCFNVYDQRLYAIKICRKSQFIQSITRHSQTSKLRRNSHQQSYSSLPSPGGLGSSSRPVDFLGTGGAAGSHVGGFGSRNGFSCAAQQQQQQQQFLGGLTAAAPGSVSCCQQQAHGGGRPVTNLVAASNAAAFGLEQPHSAASAAAVAAAAAAAAGALFACNNSSSSAFSSGLGAAAAAPGPFQGARGGQGFGKPMALEMFNSNSCSRRTNSYSVTEQQHQLPPAPGHQTCGAGMNSFGHQLAPVAFGAALAGAPGGAFNHSIASASSSMNCLGTDGSMGSASVFQEALMRYQTEEMVKEIAILKKLNHGNIVNLVEIIDDPSTDSLLLVMEYVEGGTLEPVRVGRAEWEVLKEQDIWKHVREVLQGLDYLHFNKVVHGDLKPANLLLDNNSHKVKIADFGSSMIAGSDKLFSMRNSPGFSTPAFRSPESLTSGYQPSYEMDMWALGVCVYMWAYGRLPFTGAAPFVIYEKIRSQDLHLPKRDDVSPELQDFILQLLDKDVLKRLDVVAAMQHPWVTLDGTAPLRSQREQQFAASLGLSSGFGSACEAGGSCASPGAVVLTEEDIQTAIQQMDGGVGELMDVVFTEMQYADGQEIICAGELADKMYLIARGEVEIFQEITGGVAGAETLISGVEMDLGECQDGDVFDSCVPDLGSSPTGMTSVMLLGDVLPPLNRAPSSSGSSWGAQVHSNSSATMVMPRQQRLLAVKGPGDSVGLPSKVTANLKECSGRDYQWQVAVRARGQVTLFVAKVSDLAKLVETHPEMEQAVKQIVTQQETDMMVAEAIRQLRLFNDFQHQHRFTSGVAVVV